MLGGVGFWQIVERYDRALTKEELLNPEARRKPSAASGPLNYLLIGSDQRPRQTSDDQRSDTIIIAHVPKGMDRAYLVSVPRDLLVQIPSAPNGYPGGTDKINAAFQAGGTDQGGTQLLSATLTNLTGLRFDGAALINFEGFKKVVDLLGGVRMCVDTEVRSIHTNAVFTPGCHEMNGAQALDFARQRYGLPGGDYDRQRHQQQLLRAIMERAGAADVVGNPVKLDQVLRAAGSALTVDTNGVPVESLAFSLRGLRSDQISGVQLPSYPEEGYGISYVRLDPSGDGLFAALRENRVREWAEANPRWVNRL